MSRFVFDSAKQLFIGLLTECTEITLPTANTTSCTAECNNSERMPKCATTAHQQAMSNSVDTTSQRTTTYPNLDATYCCAAVND